MKLEDSVSSELSSFCRLHLVNFELWATDCYFSDQGSSKIAEAWLLVRTVLLCQGSSPQYCEISSTGKDLCIHASCPEDSSKSHQWDGLIHYNKWLRRVLQCLFLCFLETPQRCLWWFHFPTKLYLHLGLLESFWTSLI